MRTIRDLLVPALLLAGWVGSAAAQPPEPPPIKPRVESPDPTIPSPRMRDMIGGSKPATATGVAKLPTVLIRGRVLAKGRPPAALVEIDGKVYAITQGTTLVVGGTQTLKFIEVTADQIRYELNASRDAFSAE